MAIEVLAIEESGVTAAGLRLGNFQATQGGNGVTLPDDLKVVHLPTPGPFVRVQRGSSGSATLRSRYPSAAGQSYSTLMTDGFEDIPVPATGSGSGATRYVIQRVIDPDFEGQTALAEFALVPGAANLGFPYNLGLSYPHVVLARFTQKPSTSTIAPPDTPIQDLRRLANPRQSRDMRLLFPEADITMSKTGYTSWPFRGVMAQIPVPDWATNLSIVAHVNGIEMTGSGVNAGGVRTGFAGNYAQNGIIKTGAGQAGWQSLTIVGNHTITQAMRNAGVGDMVLQGYQTLGAGTIVADYQSGIAVDWQFSEVPV